MKKVSYLLMIILTVAFASCGKDGAVGPEGPQGSKGDTGAPGVAGTDGKTILNGTADPASSLGQVGDFYINTNSYVVFGPKAASGWGSGKSILGAKGDRGDTGARGATGAKGDKGDTGARGATGAKGDKGDKGEADYVILSGANDPTNAIGEYGDFYFNTVTKTLFYRYIAILGSPAWGQIAKLSNTVQFTKTLNIPASTEISFDFDLPYAVLATSMVNAYLKRNGASFWYPLPGNVLGNNALRVYYGPVVNNAEKTRMSIGRIPGSTGTDAFPNAELRIVVTEAEVFRIISQQVDFNDYTEVSRYFQFGNE